MKLIHMLRVAAGLALCAQAGAQTSTPYQWDSVAIGGGGFVSALVMSRTLGPSEPWSASTARIAPGGSLVPNLVIRG